MRIVIKIGTQSLLGGDETLDTAMVDALVSQIAALKQSGHEIVLVSSGAVGAGRALWSRRAQKNISGDEVLEKQVLASLGQASLIQSYNKALSGHDMVAAQLLITRHDFRHRRHSVTVGRLLETLVTRKHIVPVVNENDSLAVEELMFTDNDELAGLAAAQIGANRLILLTDVDGVYGPDGIIREIAHEKEFAAIDTSGKGGGRGGMASKLDTAKKMAQAGIGTHIAHAKETDILARLIREEAVGTFIKPRRRKKPMKRWLAAGVQRTRGQVSVNEKLAEKLFTQGQAVSLLPVGLVDIPVPFDKDDVVEIIDGAGKKLGHGVARYDAQTLRGYLGRRNKPVFIHYNALHIEQ